MIRLGSLLDSPDTGCSPAIRGPDDNDGKRFLFPQVIRRRSRATTVFEARGWQLHTDGAASGAANEGAAREVLFGLWPGHGPGLHGKIAWADGRP